MSDILKRELDTFEKYKASLLGSDRGRFVLIKDDVVMGMFESEVDAVNYGYQQLGNVPFLVKRIQEIDTPLTFTSFRFQP
jgi:hypothetical protein